jgi:AraC family transcriptional regulator, regulatory protein of adaptative response / methylated-DNA-[protein]-cysteine methyltransferase
MHRNGYLPCEDDRDNGHRTDTMPTATTHTQQRDTRTGARPGKGRSPEERDDVRPSAAEVIHFAIIECSLGALVMAQSAKGIIAVLLGDDRDELRQELQRRFPAVALVAGDAKVEARAREVSAFLESPARGLHVPLDMRGTDFQRTVWEALRRIPAGSTESYADIARRIGMPKSVRAVAQACAANPLAIVVPCHRVVRSDGTLSGYRWGVERKRALLEKEAAS